MKRTLTVAADAETIINAVCAIRAWVGDQILGCDHDQEVEGWIADPHRAIELRVSACSLTMVGPLYCRIETEESDELAADTAVDTDPEENSFGEGC